jgi:hypothetical protein
MVGALICVGFAVAGNVPRPWLVLESGGMVLFALVARMLRERKGWMLFSPSIFATEPLLEGAGMLSAASLK